MPRLRIVIAAFCLLSLAGPARAAGAIDEDSFVRIGGIEQWITIKGRDRANPVLLLLHGGPAVTFTPQADAMFRGWDKDFTLVSGTSAARAALLPAMAARPSHPA